MPEPVRIRIAELLYQRTYDVHRNSARWTGPVRVVDRVEISREGREKLKEFKPESCAQSPFGDEENKQDRDSGLQESLNILKLNPKAGPEEIRKAYLEAVSKYHPDRYQGLPPEFRMVAEEKTKQINSAYENLTRKRHDSWA